MPKRAGSISRWCCCRRPAPRSTSIAISKSAATSSAIWSWRSRTWSRCRQAHEASVMVLLASICSMLAASACFILAACAAGAASITVPDNSTGLAGVAAATTALLLDAGVKPQNAGGGVFVLDAKNFHCDQNLNGALDASNVRAGLPALKCRINSQNKRGTSAGQPFGEGRALTELLQKVQGSNPPGGAAFSDCGMGYCGLFAKSIKCTIDTKIGNFSNGGRWSCVFTDGQ